MTVELSIEIYSLTAILKAIRNQQVFANWSINEKLNSNITVGFSETYQKKNPTVCVQLFRTQLNDEQIRENLERDFKAVRDLLVEQAFKPIARSSKR